ncbi:hypothetical protein, partial [Mycobacterium sp.]|uniref:hypothetical protein n=1 Tax=Mycobacterium sp. TaxID=1785 RepID=UPI003F7D22B9
SAITHRKDNSEFHLWSAITPASECSSDMLPDEHDNCFRCVAGGCVKCAYQGLSRLEGAFAG